MPTRNVHTTHNKVADNWRNISEGALKPSKVFKKKAAAQIAGQQIAKRNKVEHLVHNMDGKIAQRNSYGKDPFPPKG